MEIRRYDSGLLASNMYVITENGHAVVIDPARDTSPGRGLAVDLLLLTHEHYDHISGVNAWKQAFGAPLLCSAACAARLPDPSKNLARHFDTLCEIQTWQKIDVLPEIDTVYSCMADRTFEDELEFKWQGHRFRLLALPGHSPGGCGIFLDDSDFFSGDSMLENQDIELRFPGGSAKDWHELGEPRIRALKPGTRIWPGHFDRFVLK